MKVFISYPASDGQNLAEAASAVLQKHGHNPWYFAGNRTLGYLYWDELTYRIREWADTSLYLCTDASRNSSGQRWEIAQGLQEWPKLLLLAIPIDHARVPKKIDVFSYNHSLVSRNFEEEFENIAKDLKGILDTYMRLDRDLRASIRSI